MQWEPGCIAALRAHSSTGPSNGLTPGETDKHEQLTGRDVLNDPRCRFWRAQVGTHRLAPYVEAGAHMYRHGRAASVDRQPRREAGELGVHTRANRNRTSSTATFAHR
jgi:hypothetical protein